MTRHSVAGKAKSRYNVFLCNEHMRSQEKPGNESIVDRHSVAGKTNRSEGLTTVRKVY